MSLPPSDAGPQSRPVPSVDPQPARTSSGPTPEAWLRGPVAGVPTALQPVAHALIQALEEVESAVVDVGPDELWNGPGGAASIGFHLRHMAGSLDRLLSYARGEPLTEGQRGALKREREGAPPGRVAPLLDELRAAVEKALDQLRDTREESLDDSRSVGRAQLPSSVRGLLHHAGEHTARHAGQVVTTRKVLRGG